MVVTREVHAHAQLHLLCHGKVWCLPVRGLGNFLGSEGGARKEEWTPQFFSIFFFSIFFNFLHSQNFPRPPGVGSDWSKPAVAHPIITRESKKIVDLVHNLTEPNLRSWCEWRMGCRVFRIRKSALMQIRNTPPALDR